MMPTAWELCQAIGGVWISGPVQTLVPGIISKFSGIKKGFIYFDIGAYSIPWTIQSGAGGVVTTKARRPSDPPPGLVVIEVDDPRKAFWDGVKFLRDQYQIPVVGVTGTAGKTTTSSMITSILRTRWKTMMTSGNLNLPDFLPDQVRRLRRGYQAAVFELGMNRPGQVSLGSLIVSPAIGVITNIGPGHLENLGTVEAVIREKAGIMAGIQGGHLVLNADDPSTAAIDLTDFTGKVVYFGLGAKAQIRGISWRAKGQGTSLTVQSRGGKQKYYIPTYGEHNVRNALAAIAVANILGFRPEAIRKGLAEFQRPKQRQQMVPGIRGCEIIDDTFNANPTSVRSGLNVLAQLANGRPRVAVLGEMAEQGAYAKENHRQMGSHLESLGIEYLMTIGEMAKEIARGVKSKRIKKWSVESNTEAVRFLRRHLPDGSLVLVKGSHSAKLGEVVGGLRPRQNKQRRHR